MLDENLKEPWEKAVYCAISNSLDYSKGTLDSAREPELRRSCNAFLADQGQGQDAFEVLLAQALERKGPVGRIPFWVIAGLAIGLPASVLELGILITAGFGLATLVLLLIALSLVKDCIRYLLVNRQVMKAVKLWKHSEGPDRQTVLRQMAELFEE